MNGLTLDASSPTGLELRSAGGGYALTIPAHGIYEKAVRLAVESAKEPSALELTVGEGARVRFVFDYRGACDLALRIDVRTAAYVDVFHLDAHSGGDLSSRSTYVLDEHASVNVWTFSTGGSGALSHGVEFRKPHGFAALHGLSLLSGRSQVTHRIRAFHGAGHCVSRQFYKSIVSADAKSTFESMVEVVRGADKSDSKQLNRNLLLSKNAQAVSRPELKIDSDDVACAHGSATGELSRDEIFYARTRGIAEDQARFLMIEGFAGEILERLPEIPLKADLSARMRAKLPDLAEV